MSNANICTTVTASLTHYGHVNAVLLDCYRVHGIVYSERHKVYVVAMLLTAARCIHLIDIVKDSMQGDLSIISHPVKMHAICNLGNNC